jgi:hypothetical protein
LLHLLLETWKRFDIPLALTEVHMHCTREEQIRWLKEKFDITTLCMQHDIPVKAITAWSLLGAYGWNKLLTEPPYTYEPGVFDLTFGEPRPTALAKLLKSFSKHEKYNHPILDQPAWWARKDRYVIKEDCETETCNTASRSIFILCNEVNTLLADCIHHICNRRGILSYIVHLEADQDQSEIKKLMDTYNPWAVLSTNDLFRARTIYNLDEQTPEISYADQGIKFAALIPSWRFVPGKYDNHMPLQKLFVKLGPSGVSDFLAAENIFKTDSCTLTTILSSLPYISEFIHTTLNLLIDDECGVWEASKYSNTKIHDGILEGAFD